MTAKQILDAFSETLMQDERILSGRERELLTNLLQTSKTVSSSNPELQSAVAAAIAQSVGETVAQRAFALLGGSIVEQILAGSGISMEAEISTATPVLFGVPQPPGGPKGVPQPPSGPGPKGVPQPPSGPKGVPQPPSGPQGLRPLSVPVQERIQQSQLDSTSGVGVLESPPIVRAQCVVLDEFLAP